MGRIAEWTLEWVYAAGGFGGGCIWWILGSILQAGSLPAKWPGVRESSGRSLGALFRTSRGKDVERKGCATLRRTDLPGRVCKYIGWFALTSRPVRSQEWLGLGLLDQAQMASPRGPVPLAQHNPTGNCCHFRGVHNLETSIFQRVRRLSQISATTF